MGMFNDFKYFVIWKFVMNGEIFYWFFKNLKCNIYLIKYLVCCWFCVYFVVKLDLNVVVGNYI